MSSESSTSPAGAPVKTRSRGANTAQRALDVAERLVQTRGFNGFSYADVARELGITKASLHYHFPGKAELGEALIARYTARFIDALEGIDREIPDAREKLDAYAGIYSGVLQQGRMCLCGILAAEYGTLPEPMRETVTAFFDANRAWLTAVLTQGRTDGVLAITGPPAEASQMLLSGLEGAMLIARAGGGVARFESSARLLVGTLAP
jgi:TetR/AcrR family transcriptional repressor of nem operon